jgi:hypothetical protein
MGLSRDIEKSGLFPEQIGNPELDFDELASKATVRPNHPSFSELHGEAVAPGIKLLEDQLNYGFGLLFADREAAASYLGADVHPAPLGNIAKVRPDGTFKHRLIQDLRRNYVNDAVLLPERQVLPRPVDDARDLGLLSEGLRSHEELSMFILDYADAFMSIPLHPDERCYNCAEVELPLARNRKAAFEWGGLQGLLYRLASSWVRWQAESLGLQPRGVVCHEDRAGLGGVPNRRTQSPLLARARGQLYVDDPIWGSPARPRRT